MNKARAQIFWKQLLMYKNLTQKNQLLCLDFEQVMAILVLKNIKVKQKSIKTDFLKKI